MAQSSDVRQQSCSPPPTRDTSEIMTDELPPSRANLEVRADLTEPANKVTEAGLDVVSSVRNVGLLFGELTGIGVDAIRAWRERNAFRLRCRMEEIRSERSVNQQRNLNPKDASKMLAAATIEEDDRLAEMWAQLIVSARDPARSPLDMAVVDAFQAFTRLDAEVLVALAAAETAAVQQRAVDIGSKFEEERRKAIGAANERTTLERLAADEAASQRRSAHRGVDATLVAARLEAPELDVDISLRKLRQLGCAAAGAGDTPATWGAIRLPGELEVARYCVSPVGRELLERVQTPAVEDR